VILDKPPPRAGARYEDGRIHPKIRAPMRDGPRRFVPSNRAGQGPGAGRSSPGPFRPALLSPSAQAAREKSTRPKLLSTSIIASRPWRRLPLPCFLLPGRRDQRARSHACLRWALPLPLVQIALGAFIASVANPRRQKLKPDIFLSFLFLPPLPLPGWLAHSEGGVVSATKEQSWSWRLGLVRVQRSLASGYFINWMIPAIAAGRRPSRFAAIVSPTDPYRSFRDRYPCADPEAIDARS